MVATCSHMLPLGTRAPEFTLLDTVSGKMQSLAMLTTGKRATVVLFICNHCPYVLHINSRLVALADAYQQKGVQFIAISSNDATRYPQDGPQQMTQHALQNGYVFAYLYDETQAVAKAYHAACTPDFYVFDAQLSCIYRGRFDASRPGSTIPVTGEDLALALDLALEGKQLSEKNQYPSVGCNIKWKEGSGNYV